MSRREAEALLRDNHNSRIGGRGSPQRPPTDRGAPNAAANLVVGTPNVATTAPARNTPPNPPPTPQHNTPPTSPGLLPESLEYVVVTVLNQIADGILAKALVLSKYRT